MASRQNLEKKSREERDRLRLHTARQELHNSKQRRRVRDNYIALAALVVLLGGAAFAQITYFSSGPGKVVATATPTPTATPTTGATPSASATPAAGKNEGPVPDKSLAEGRTWNGTLTLNAIPLNFELDGAKAPQAVSSEISLIQKGFYNNVTCHRLVTQGIFVLQCGDPQGNGTGGPGYSYGPVENVPADAVYPAGTIAMARSSSTYSNGSQFFIVYKDSTIGAGSDGYTVIGKITSGLEQLIAGITDAGTADGASDGKPKVPTTITSISIK